MSEATVIREFCERRDRERAKAIAKYGEIALEPGGDPRRNVIDYAINELVGMPRYAEMIEYRIRSIEGLPAQFRDEAIAVCRAMSANASRHAFDLINIQQKLLRRGIKLGKAEAA